MFSIDEYNAVRHAAGMLERSARGQIAVLGSDRASFLQGLLTNDIAALVAGRGCYAVHLTPQGRMVADMVVLNLGGEILLDVPRAVTDTLVRRFDQFIFTEEVQVVDVTARWVGWGVHGPRAPAILASVLDNGDAGEDVERRAEALAAWHEHDNARWIFDRNTLVVSRSDEFGGPGFNLYVDPAHASSVREALLEARVRAISSETADVLRVEAGRPEFLIDMDEETIPLEVGIEDRAISFTKGCYVGQEVIIRVLHRGHGRVAEKLVGLTIEDERPEVPCRGDRLVRDDKEIGRVTSAAFSPAVGKPIALGYVQRVFSEAGTNVQVRHGDRHLAARVTTMPFVQARRQAGG